MSLVLVINSGSSSFKYRLLEVSDGRALASGLVERIGLPDGVAHHTVHAAALAPRHGPAPAVMDAEYSQRQPIADHAAGFAVMLQAFATDGPSLREHSPVAVGHRVVHGGARFIAPTLIDDAVLASIDDLSRLAPLHNPGAVQGIRAARAAFGSVPHVAVFDTAFHQSMPPEAYTYAIDRETAQAHGLRKYGFHGTSHQYVSRAAAEFLGRPLAQLKQVVLHLGNGASITAVDGGRSVDTSMGLTPLEGLVMGTRSGDLDPAVLIQLARRAGMSTDELDVLLNRDSGLKGLAGVSDMRDIERRRAASDPLAVLAFDVYIHRIRAYLGAYLAQLGGVDVISFTAGVGENSPAVRSAALATLGFAGIRLDVDRNAAPDNAATGHVATARGIRTISADDSAVTVLVVPTDEEREIARQTAAVVG